MAEPVSTAALALGGMKILLEVMEQVKYAQRNKFKKLVNEYERQIILPFNHPDYSDDVLANLCDIMLQHGREFSSSLQSESKE